MKDVQCGTWTDKHADNWISVFFREETGQYMMEYDLYLGSGVRGRNVFKKDFFDTVLKQYDMKRAF